MPTTGEAVRFLDQHYIPTRFRTAIDDEMPPTRYYEKGDADACLQSASSILEHVRHFFEHWRDWGRFVCRTRRRPRLFFGTLACDAQHKRGHADFS
jgi:hypothetical protein